MVNIPKVGRVRFRWTKDLPIGRHAGSDNRITGARLVKDALGWHIALRLQTLQAKPEPHQGPEVGIDAGVNLPLALSDGNHQDHGRAPRLPDGTADRDKWLNLDEKAKLLRLEQRAAGRKAHRKPGEKTPRRLHHTYDQIKSLRARATRRATDWQHKATTDIARTYGTVVVENLTITNMVRSAKGTAQKPGKNVAQKSGLNRSIAQEAWGRTVTMLTYKTARHGGTLHKVRRCEHVPALLRVWLHHTRKPRGPGHVRAQEPRLRMVRQRRPQRSPEHLAPVPDGPRAHPGCREGSRQAHEARQARCRSCRKVSRNLLPELAKGGEHFKVPRTSQRSRRAPCQAPLTTDRRRWRHHHFCESQIA